MAMGKNYRVMEKNKPEQPQSIILEHRSRPETLLFESQAVANLCEKLFLSIFSFSLNLKKSFSIRSRSRNGSCSQAVREDFGCLRMPRRTSTQRWRDNDTLFSDGHWLFLRREDCR